MRENELHAQLRALAAVPPGFRGIGDDCCTWTPGGETCLSIDTIVAGVHFAHDAKPQCVGRKAAAAALSDLAAMAARPIGAAVALSRPQGYDDLVLMQGIHAELERHGCLLLGGDTTTSDQLVITVTVWGEASGSRLLTRSGGMLGDILAVTGMLGGSLRDGRHLHPQPRFAAANWLAGRTEVHALMDLSDGLASDAPRLAAASQLGCVLLPSEVPVHPSVNQRGDAAKQACCDGEDYELLLAVDARAWPTLQVEWPFEDLPLSRVGWLVDEQGCWVEDHRRALVPCEWSGYEH